VLWIKICATTNLDDARAALEAGANALGFILTASPRQISPEKAADIISALPPSVEKIGVVVDNSPKALAKLAADIGLTGLQLQGDEPAEQLPEFRRALGLRKIIKTLQARELLADPSRLDAYLAQRKSCDGILLDAGSAAARGGTGQTFDWSAMLPIVARIEEAARFFPRDQLALSTQCGFASGIKGNPVEPAMQERKLALVAEVARRVWG